MLDKWQELIIFYLNETCGALLGGIVHNLNNHVHSFKLQNELFAQKLEMGKIDSEHKQTKNFVQKISSGAAELSSFSQHLERRIHFLAPEQLEINLHDFFDWLTSFWINHLFFKHQIELKLTLDPNLPYFIQVPAQAFTFCMEEGLKNAVTACQEKSRQTDMANDFALELAAQATDQTHLEFSLSSPTKLPPDLDPWTEGSTTIPGRLGMGLPLVKRICRALNWTCTLDSDETGTLYKIIITNPVS